MKIFSCGFCGAPFHSSQSLAEHYDNHFSPEKCDKCDQQVLLINGDYYVLQLHTKCQQEYQHISHRNEKGSTSVSNILTEVDVKEEVFDDPLISEAHLNSQYQKQTNDREEENDYYDVKHFVGVHCSGESGGGDFSIVKVEDTADSENCFVKSDVEGTRTKGQDPSDPPKIAAESKQGKFFRLWDFSKEIRSA